MCIKCTNNSCEDCQRRLKRNAKNRAEWATKRKEKSKAYKLANKDKIREQNRQRNLKNKDKRKIYGKWWYEQNKKEVFQKHTAYVKERKQRDPQFKLTRALRSRFKIALKKNVKTGSAVDDMGCTVDECKSYLESLFYNNPKTQEPMSWENHGKGSWHIDHIIPLCQFNLTNPSEMKKACNYKNLQPLWEEEHKIKTIKDKQDCKNKVTSSY